MDELPENCAVPPVKPRGRPDGSIDWYNLKKSKRAKPLWCGEFDECRENSKVQGLLHNVAYNEGKNAFREDAIMHALEIERSHFPNEGHLNTYGSCASMKDQISEPTNKNTECGKQDISSIQGRRGYKLKIMSFVPLLSEESPKRDNSALLHLDEWTTKCQALDSRAVALDATVEVAVFKPTELENNVQVYDVEMAVHGKYTGHGLPLAFLMSKLTGKSIKGYPITVEVLEDSCPAQNPEDHRPAVSSFHCLMESRISVLRRARSSYTSRKPSGSKKTSKHDYDSSRKNQRERSTRKPAVAEGSPSLIHLSASSPREMVSFSSFAGTPGESANRKHVPMNGSPPPIHLTSKPASSLRKMRCFSSQTASL